jgi:hypothetical protein
VLVVLLLSMWSSHASAREDVKATDRSTEGPSEQLDETSSVESKEGESPAQSEKEPRRRIFKRVGPQPMTAEEIEEAERLRKIAARYGTDPTAIVGRLQLTGQYLDLPHGAQATASVARVDLPFRGNYLLRMDMPFLKTTSPNSPGAPSHSGASDLAVTAGWRVYNTPEYAVLVGAITTFPTAAHDALGFGKYTVGPAIATARFLPQLDSFLIGLLQYQTSVGGDPSRKDVSFLGVTAQINSFWGRHWWTVVQSVCKSISSAAGKAA